MNPFLLRPRPIEEMYMSWQTAYPKPYDKSVVDPYTKIRIILMNGIEVEAAFFSHQFHRNCYNQDIRRNLAVMRRIEQQQQKHINWLKPIDETQLETTIGYEHVAVDLTAWLAQHEPDPYVRQALDFALLEDFDHLYRYSNLLDLDANIPSQNLVKNYVEITPGRPTIAEHRHPMDAVKRPINGRIADIRTKLNTLIITSAEQQTMNFYMNIGNTYKNDIGRQLYLEIAMIEEQHVSHYGSLLDPNMTWLENLLLHEYMECYLYYSFYEDELDPAIKRVWEMHFDQEVAHLHMAAQMLKQYDNTNWQQIVPGEFPEPLQFHDTRQYVRDVLANQVELTSVREEYKSVRDLPSDFEFFTYQNRVHGDVSSVVSHQVIDRRIAAKGEDYRAETMGENPVLQNRTIDDITIARTKS